MNRLMKEAVELLKAGHFEYAICGGFAIELFLGKEIRKHGDIDILAYWNDRDLIIQYMNSLGWEVYEMCGGGVAHHITDVSNQLRIKRNIFCIKDHCELISLTQADKPDMYYLDFSHSGQKSLNFIEFLFNDRTETDFLYARSFDVKRELTKALLICDDITYLAPELVLLYKSTDINREGYQMDFDEAYARMNKDQKNWLQNALIKLYPAGHPWIKLEGGIKIGKDRTL